MYIGILLYSAFFCLGKTLYKHICFCDLFFQLKFICQIFPERYYYMNDLVGITESELNWMTSLSSGDGLCMKTLIPSGHYLTNTCGQTQRFTWLHDIERLNVTPPPPPTHTHTHSHDTSMTSSAAASPPDTLSLLHVPVESIFYVRCAPPHCMQRAI